MSNPGFIIGGGPSLSGFDFRSLRGKRCMAINVAFKEVPWADIALIGDTRLLDHLADDKDWDRFTGDRYTRASQLSRAKEPQPKDITPLETQEAWSRQKGCVVSLGNTGLCGLNLAELLGWSPLFLLGFDCGGFDETGRLANYHLRYPLRWLKPGLYLVDKFTQAFRAVIGDIRAEVYNCDSKSGLECFPKITFQEAIAKYVEAEGQGVPADVCQRVD